MAWARQSGSPADLVQKPLSPEAISGPNVSTRACTPPHPSHDPGCLLETDAQATISPGPRAGSVGARTVRHVHDCVKELC